MEIFLPKLMTMAAVIFDLDNTLYDSEQYFTGAFEAVSKYLNEKYAISQVYVFSKLNQLWNEKTSMYPHLFNDLLDFLDMQSELANVVRIFNEYDGKLEPYPDVIDVLKQLKSGNHKLAIITDGNIERQKRKIGKLGIVDLFDTMVFTKDTENPKPSHIPFQKALDQLGAISPSSFYVADNPFIDFQGAKNLGIRTIRVLRGQFKNVPRNDYIDFEVSEFNDIPAIVNHRRIAVVTGTRAEFGMLKPLLAKIVASKELELELLVTGMHLLDKYGSTVNEIKDSGFEISATVKMYEDDDSDATYHGRALARALDGFTDELSKTKPDLLVVDGDRLESLAATLAAATLRIPIAHIHGGDRTDSGHIDESIRHSITRFAHIHFPATDEHAKRLEKMGEESRRIFKVGALGLDSILGQKPIPKEELMKRLGIDSYEQLAVCIFHPVLLEKEDAGRQMHEILEAVKGLGIHTVVIYPNNDAGSEDIIAEIDKYATLPNISLFRSLPHEEYVSLLRYADLLIGNSSSGIIEAPSVKLPVVNVGSRNRGRDHADNVLFVDTNKSEIVRAVRTALNSKKFREKVGQCKNPYGDGKASERIVKLLRTVRIDRNLLLKKLSY